MTAWYSNNQLLLLLWYTSQFPISTSFSTWISHGPISRTCSHCYREQKWFHGKSKASYHSETSDKLCDPPLYFPASFCSSFRPKSRSCGLSATVDISATSVASWEREREPEQQRGLTLDHHFSRASIYLVFLAAAGVSFSPYSFFWTYIHSHTVQWSSLYPLPANSLIDSFVPTRVLTYSKTDTIQNDPWLPVETVRHPAAPLCPLSSASP